MRDQKKILLTGAAGFVGWNLARRMLSAGLAPILLTHRTPVELVGLEQIRCDLREADNVEQAVKRLRPDAVIHCAALSGGRDCEADPDAARRGNVDATINLIQAAGFKARFILFSTDLVFDGLQGTYHEQDAPRPGNQYGRSKVQAELMTAALSSNAVILRSALVYGPNAPHYSCFLGWMHAACQAGRPLTLFTDEYRSPIYVEDLCELVLRLLDADFTGVLHAAGPERLSRYEFGLKFCRAFEYSASGLLPKKLVESGSPLYRPPDVSLNIELAEKLFAFAPRGVDAGLTELAAVKECAR